MKILIVCQYFWPENFLINQIALDLSKKGHEISVLTSQPNYPKGNIYKGYKSYEFKEEKLKDITIHRVPIFPRKQNIISLLLNYITFPLSGCYFAKRF